MNPRHIRFELTSRHVRWIIAFVVATLAVRLVMFVDRYAVNLIYLDQWDFLSGLMEGASPWELFRWQHGVERQGLGNLISAVVLSETGWNAKADATTAAVLMLLTCASALWLVKRICGRMNPWDITVPLIFLTTTNVEGDVPVAVEI